MHRRNSQQYFRRPLWAATVPLPILQRVHTNSEQCGELGLAQLLERCAIEVRHRFAAAPVDLIHEPVHYRTQEELSRLSDKDPRTIPFVTDKRYTSQAEYRAVFPRRGGFRLTQTIGTSIPTFDRQIARAKPEHRLLRLGRCESLHM